MSVFSLRNRACENRLAKTMLAWMPTSSDTSASAANLEAKTEPFATGFVGRLVKVGRVIRAILREIFDESAYERFLARTQVQSSPRAYAAFRQENDQSKSRRPRCC